MDRYSVGSIGRSGVHSRRILPVVVSVGSTLLALAALVRVDPPSRSVRPLRERFRAEFEQAARGTAIAVNPRDPDTVYVGGAQGGVWKTSNARDPHPTWMPLTDHEASLAVGSIAIDPVDPDIIYVGTGEPNRSCDSYYGRGI